MYGFISGISDIEVVNIYELYVSVDIYDYTV